MKEEAKSIKAGNGVWDQITSKMGNTYSGFSKDDLDKALEMLLKSDKEITEDARIESERLMEIELNRNRYERRKLTEKKKTK